MQLVKQLVKLVRLVNQLVKLVKELVKTAEQCGLLLNLLGGGGHVQVLKASYTSSFAHRCLRPHALVA